VRGEKWWASEEKERFDRSITRMLMPAVFGVMGIGGGWVWMTDRKKPVIRLKRWHPQGEIQIMKIRTMVDGAEKMDEQVFGGRPLREIKVNRRDPRIMRGCEWLRVLSLDEMPQFINVKNGEMSIVGPRPISDYEVKLELEPNLEFEPYREWSEWLTKGLRFGITGVGQVITRRLCVPMEMRMRIDNLYAREASLIGDLRIILATLAPGVIFGGR